jgi:gliding motility-associated-like protein
MWITFKTTETCAWGNEGSIDATQFGGRLPVTYSWNNGEFTEDLNNLKPGTYTLTVTDNYGRQVSAEATVEAKIKDLNCLNIPNAFTPDGDGTNDNWVMKSLSEFSSCSVEIFNSWGSLIFKSEGYKTPWDGRFNGDYVPAGTYYFVIKLGENDKEFTGTVTIIK